MRYHEIVSDWIGTREAAAHLGITVHTPYRFIDEGRLPAH
jgi:excisionase family DNA binding protein